MIGIMSLGLGNVGSVENMLRVIGYETVLLPSPPEHTDSFRALILPGVGSYDSGMRAVNQSGWGDYLRLGLSETEKAPWLMGICLGMQLLCEGSEEGNESGLGLIPGRFRKFTGSSDSASRLKVPHMGWNRVEFDTTKVPWSREIPEDSRFYFVHSYRYTAPSPEFVLGTTTYGSEFASAIGRDRVVGFQFHPEKSHRFGKALFRALFEHIHADGND